MIIQKRTFGIEYELIWNTPEKTWNNIFEEMRKKVTMEIHPGEYHHTRGGNNFWDVKYDATIHGGSHQAEIASPVLEGIKGLEALKEVNEWLVKTGAEVNSSCGIHIHHSSNGLDEAALLRLYYTYCILEESLFDIFCIGRKGNNYCRSSSFSPTTDIVRMLKRREKYWALNFRPVENQGTVEFRALAGTLDFDMIQQWIVLTQRLVYIAKIKPRFPETDSLEDFFEDYLELNQDDEEKEITQKFLNNINTEDKECVV